MAVLLNLPDELLLQIANDVRSKDGIRGKDILRLCLASRRLRTVAQEVTYAHPSFADATALRPDQSSRPVYLLARTLLECRDLAKFVRAIDIVVVSTERTPVSDATVRMSQKLLEGLGLASSNGMNALRSGRPDVWAGIVLAAVPNLRHLDLKLYGCRDFDTGYLVTNRFNPAQWFTYQPDFDAKTVPGLANLTSIRSSGVLTPSVFNLPNLQEAHFAECSVSLDVRSVAPLASSITRLTINVGIAALQTRALFQQTQNMLGGQEYSETLLPRLTGLKHLSINLTTESMRYGATHFHLLHHSYTEITAGLGSTSLETLVIDTEEVEALASTAAGGNACRLLNAIQPAQSLARLPNLRRVTAPQELFGRFPVDSMQKHVHDVCLLPHGVEEVAILYTTKVIHPDDILGLLKRKMALPALTKATITRSNRLEKHQF
ncbi:hypothetical protein BU26DRAFT_567937 [Trematosphaeria pertusa]|uniref:F-box domain-containing protein n=1 Tax=Trematosphaeria pertusa TaxID=390896 RepID=A0A6A6I4R7_9PLEO|nr:uncharacterized protein BU26DRAFT_567937 [Trematosphaeria pertusa]KAF2245341.1 hypothetical protein BU26DRAFT_567937 [Trematosphaeria pertusa]